MAIPGQLLRKVERLEPLPATLRRLMGLLGDEDVPFTAIVDVVEHDQAVAANILRSANSASMGGRREITSLRAAVIRLGLNMLTELVLGNHLRQMAPGAPVYDRAEDDLWLHGAVSGAAAELIASRADGAAVPRTASIAALVHDVGKLLMVRYLGADVRALRSYCDEHGVPFFEAERARFGFDHAEVGAAMARHWAFPQDVAEAIGRHHEAPLDSPGPLLDAVILANSAAKAIGVGPGAEGMNLKVDPGGLPRGKLHLHGVFQVSLFADLDTFYRICAEAAARGEDLQCMIAAPTAGRR